MNPAWSIRRRINSRGTSPESEIAADALLYATTPLGSVAGLPQFGADLEWTGNPVNFRFFAKLEAELIRAMQQYSDDHAVDVRTSRAIVLENSEQYPITISDDELESGKAGISFYIRRVESLEFSRISGSIPAGGL